MEDSKKETKEAYNEIARDYHARRMRGNDFNELLDKKISFSFLGDVKDKRILDAGCGTGIFSKELDKKGANLFSIDLSEEMLSIARKNCKGTKIVFERGSIDDLPYENNYFDKVISNLAIHSIENPLPCLEEFGRVLKEGGVLVFSTNHPIYSSIKTVQNVKGVNQITLSNYFEKEKYYWSLYGSKTKIPAHKFNFQDWFEMIRKAGFALEAVKEATITEIKDDWPDFVKDSKGVPIFLIFKCTKKSN